MMLFQLGRWQYLLAYTGLGRHYDIGKCLKIIGIACLLFLSGNMRAQNLLWAKSAKSGPAFSPVGAEAWLVQADRYDNAYVAFYSYCDSIRLGSYVMTNSLGFNQLIIAKYDPSGNVVWAAGSRHSYAYPRGIAADTSGNVYLYGIFYSDTLAIGGQAIMKNPAWDGVYFLIKFDASGNILWIRTGGNAGFYNMCMSAIACDGANVYISGALDSATCTIGSIVLTNNNPGKRNIFIAKYDAAGNALWAKQAGGAGNDEPDMFAVAGTGELYLSGSFTSPVINFGSIALTNPGTYALFIVKYDVAGNAIWARSALAVAYSTITGSSFDDSNNLYITGRYFTNISLGNNTFISGNFFGAGFFARYDTNGNLDWAKNINQAGTPFLNGTAVYAVSKDACNNMWISGGLADSSSTLLDGHVLNAPPNSYDPMFVAKYSTAGNVLTYFTLNSGGDDNVGISADAQGNFYVSGDYITDLYIGNDTLSSKVPEMFFIAKYSLIVSDSTYLKDTVCTQSSTVLNAPTGYLSYEWNDGSTQSFHPVNGNDTLWVRCIASCGAPLTDTFVVQNFIPFSLGDDTTICGGSLLLKVPITASSYLWQDGSTANTYTVTHSGTYSVTVNEQLCNYSDTIAVNIIGLQQHNSDTILCKENFTQLTLQSVAPSGATVLWSDNSTNTSLTVKDTGIYWYTISESQCSTTDTFFVNTEYCDCWFQFPNAFTPNNDGRNDVFNIILQPSCNITNYKLSIYNRWGQQVFTTQNPSQGWNGKLNGVDVEIGSYFYYAEFNAGTQNIKHSHKGDVTLLR